MEQHRILALAVRDRILASSSHSSESPPKKTTTKARLGTDTTTNGRASNDNDKETPTCAQATPTVSPSASSEESSGGITMNGHKENGAATRDKGTTEVDDTGTNDTATTTTTTDNGQKKNPPPEHLKEKFCHWAASFARLDPRIRIHRFFHGISQKGEMKLTEATLKRQRTADALDLGTSSHQHSKSEREILASCFNLASVFTVWRPCSHQAIRRMMSGEGVGKGLDIKGKSAKTGKCSGYVPFLQIHSQSDKHKIDWLPKTGRLSIYYPCAETRKLAYQVASQVCQEMVATVECLDDSMTQQRDSISESVRSAAEQQQQGTSLASTTVAGNMDNSDDGIMDESSTRISRRGSDESHVDRSSWTTFEPILHHSIHQKRRSSASVLEYCAASQQLQRWEMKFPFINLDDKYASEGVYGMELPERLFWEAFVIRQDQHCQKWRLFQETTESNNKPNGAEEPPRRLGYCTPVNNNNTKRNFAQLLMEQLLHVTEAQTEFDEPVIEWIDEANLPPESPSNGNNNTLLAEEGAPITALIEEDDEECLTDDDDDEVSAGSLGDFGSNHSLAFTASTDTLPSFNRATTSKSTNKTRRGGRKRRPKKKPSSWSFVICDKERFMEHVLRPIRQRDSSFESKYSCFVGELRRSGFREQTTGTGFARYRHAYFQKDRPELCALIGSEHDTGRESIPAFQDANFKSLRKKLKQQQRVSKTGAKQPRVVLWNLPDDENPLCPHNLLMAYEENGKVVPVVSDFDGFLVGTKRIHFDKELPAEQVELMKSNIRTARDILEGGGGTSDSWAAKWQYAGRDHFSGDHKPMPRFGYGDGKSYKLMEAAVSQLAKHGGAVRHGAECFNFEYPQEMDPEFLVISDTIEGKVRWSYVDSVKLHYFLSNRIKDGYTFPLNPKWILCDPGWSKIYNELLQSDYDNIQKSLNVWFPPESGVREMIASIQKDHPVGLTFDKHGRNSTRRPSVGLPVVATYTLQSSGQHPVHLLINRGSVVQFSRPGLRTGMVCATNETCVPVCGGATQAVVEAGGRRLLKDNESLPILSETSFGPVRCRTGNAKMVSRKGGGKYGNLDVGHVIWAVGPSFGEAVSSLRDIDIKDNLLRTAYQNSLERAKEHGLEAVGFSLISAGKRGSKWDPNKSLRIAMRTLNDHREFGSLREIHVCAFTADEASALKSIAKEFGMS